MGAVKSKKLKGQFSFLLAVLLTAGTAVTALAVSNMTGTNYTESDPGPEIPLNASPGISGRMLLPSNLTRGQPAVFWMFVTNTGNASVEKVHVVWHVSPGFQTVNATENCSGGLAANSSCLSRLEVNASLGVPLGINQIRGEVRYG